jgi:hypothetical protein
MTNPLWQSKMLFRDTLFPRGCRLIALKDFVKHFEVKIEKVRCFAAQTFHWQNISLAASYSASEKIFECIGAQIDIALVDIPSRSRSSYF